MVLTGIPYPMKMDPKVLGYVGLGCEVRGCDVLNKLLPQCLQQTCVQQGNTLVCGAQRANWHAHMVVGL